MTDHDGGATAPAPDLVRAGRILARLARIIENVTQDAGLSLPQYRLMVWVEREPQRAGELASRSAVSRPTLTSLVNGLERQGFMVRVPVEGDRRGIRLELTPEGQAALAAADARVAERVGELLDAAGTPGLAEALRAVGAVLDRELEERLAAQAAESA